MRIGLSSSSLIHGTLVATLTLTVGACGTLPKGVAPEVVGVSPRIASVDLKGVDLVFDVRVDNPLPVAINAPGYGYAVSIEGRPFVDGTAKTGADLPPAGVGTAPVPIRLDYRQLFDMYEGLEGKNEIAYRLVATLDVPVLGTIQKLPFGHDGTLPVVRAPTISVVSVDSSGLSLSGASVTIDADLTNPNAFGVGLAELGYALRLGGKSAGRLSASTAGLVGPGESRRLKLVGELSTGGALEGLISGAGGRTPRIAPTGSFSTPWGQVKMSQLQSALRR